MEQLVLPKLMPFAFAHDGSKNEIPQSVASQQTNLASYASGFPNATSLPLTTGGLPVRRMDMNGIFYEITNILSFMSKGGFMPFDQTLCEAIGGYPEKAILISDDGKLYRSLVGNNTVNFNDPEADITDYWTTVGGGGSGGGGAFDELMIGAPFFLTSTVTPENAMLADGSIALFADWPRFHAKFLNGGFEGNVLPASATEEEMAQYPGKFVLNQEGTGLYLPRLNGLFPRFSTVLNDISRKNNAGVPNITGWTEQNMHSGNADGNLFVQKSLPNVLGYGGGATTYRRNTFDASRVSTVYGNSETVMPESYNQPIGIFLF